MATWIRKPAPYDDNKSLQENRERDRGSVKCPCCGHEVNMQMGDTDCEHCGQMFNASGQSLVDPSLWEEPYDEE